MSFSRLGPSPWPRRRDHNRSDVTERPATIEEAEQLSVAPGTEIVAIDRIRTLDGIPVAISYSIVPRACAPRLASLDWTTASIFDELALAGHAPVRADYSVGGAGGRRRGVDACCACPSDNRCW